jgi:uncharacterized protein YecT (DUF1311 family)
MKNMILFSLIFIVNQWCCAQWSENDLKPYRQKAEDAIRAYTDKMIETGKWDKDDIGVNLKIEFTIDTMRIERTAHLIDNERYTTLDIHNTLSYKMTEYDKLLNKYYQLLMNKLTAEDKIKVRDAQRVWLTYRDSETKINREIIAQNQYMGSGTMWPVIASVRTLEVVRERVCSLYGMLTCI